jgi:hypothetical protein
LIIAYNNDELKEDAESTKILYDNCGKYRTVDIIIHTVKNPKEIYTFPISPIIILPYLLMFLKRREETDSKNIVINEDDKDDKKNKKKKKTSTLSDD